MLQPILNTPTHDQIKLEVLRQHFPQAIETDADGRIHINASALQLAIDPSNPAGVQVCGWKKTALSYAGRTKACESAMKPKSMAKAWRSSFQA